MIPLETGVPDHVLDHVSDSFPLTLQVPTIRPRGSSTYIVGTWGVRVSILLYAEAPHFVRVSLFTLGLRVPEQGPQPGKGSRTEPSRFGLAGRRFGSRFQFTRSDTLNPKQTGARPFIIHLKASMG